MTDDPQGMHCERLASDMLYDGICDKQKYPPSVLYCKAALIKQLKEVQQTAKLPHAPNRVSNTETQHPGPLFQGISHLAWHCHEW
jgi:hypothetical protein